MIIYLQMLDDPQNQDKFTQAYLTHRDTMYQKAMAVLKNPQDAEDAVHRAFLIILKNLHKFSDVKCPKTRTYFVKIVENISIDMVRKQNRHPTVELDERIATIPVPQEHENYRLRSAIQKIPRQYQEILMYSVDAELDTSAIAKILGITRSNVQKRLWRAKEALRKQYEREEEIL